MAFLTIQVHVIVSNHVRAVDEFSSSLFKAVLSSRSQATEVVSSAKLHTSTSLKTKNNYVFLLC